MRVQLLTSHNSLSDRNLCSAALSPKKYVQINSVERAYVLKPARLKRSYNITINLTKSTAPQNQVAFSYHSVHWQYFLTIVFAATIYMPINIANQ